MRHACDPSYCRHCHNLRDCVVGLPDCYMCRDNAHDNGKNCQLIGCRTCHPVRYIPPASSTSSGSITPESMRRAVETARTMAVNNPEVQIDGLEMERRATAMLTESERIESSERFLSFMNGGR